MLSSANKDCSSFLTSAQRQHRCGEGAHAVADPGEANEGDIRVDGLLGLDVGTKRSEGRVGNLRLPVK
jgi:hypothetical protein